MEMLFYCSLICNGPNWCHFVDESRMCLCLCRLLYSLAFNARFLRHLWHLITSMTTKMITG